jgi:hypothetical protein
VAFSITSSKKHSHIHVSFVGLIFPTPVWDLIVFYFIFHAGWCTYLDALGCQILFPTESISILLLFQSLKIIISLFISYVS